MFEPYRDSYTCGAWTDTVLTVDVLRLRLQAMAVFLAEMVDDGTVADTIAASTTTREGQLRAMAVRPERS